MMVDKVARCGEGAAIAMGANVKVTKRKLYSGKKINEPLVEVLWNNYASLGVEMKHWKDSIDGIPMASTDFGDVSQKIPVASSYIGVTEPGVPGHSVQLAEATMTEKGQEAMIIGTKALAMTLVELLANSEKLNEAKEYFKNH
jgi:metal-dependent amidase/aminoacylase/carboxypeptidase family protein